MKKNKKKKNLIDYGWIIKIIIVSFIISVLFSFVSETTIPNLSIFFGVLICLMFIFIGIIFDMVGISVASADETKFHSMASKNVKGAKMAVKLKKNAEKVSTFCNDVVGDICGIVSGSTGSVISIRIAEMTGSNVLIVTLIVMGIISALTIGGKAIEKGIAMEKGTNILYYFARILSIFAR